MSRKKLAKLYSNWAFKPEDDEQPKPCVFIDPVDTEVSKLDPRVARFIRWKMKQLAEADLKRGVEPSPERLINRFKWVSEYALNIALKRSQRKLDQLNVR